MLKNLLVVAIVWTTLIGPVHATELQVGQKATPLYIDSKEPRLQIYLRGAPQAAAFVSRTTTGEILAEMISTESGSSIIRMQQEFGNREIPSNFRVKSIFQLSNRAFGVQENGEIVEIKVSGVTTPVRSWAGYPGNPDKSVPRWTASNYVVYTMGILTAGAAAATMQDPTTFGVATTCFLGLITHMCRTFERDTRNKYSISGSVEAVQWKEQPIKVKSYLSYPGQPLEDVLVTLPDGSEKSLVEMIRENERDCSRLLALKRSKAARIV